MSRAALPHLDRAGYTLTDGGLETTLVFHQGIELPHFAACELLRSDSGRDRLRAYYDVAAETAVRAGLAFSLDTATWRANPDWTTLLGCDDEEFVAVNRAAVRLARQVRNQHATPQTPIIVCGQLGPRGDGYRVDARQTVAEARAYHARQLAVFAEEGVDYAAALTLSYADEAIGIALAARDLDLPVVLSFTVEVDGRLAGGETLRSAVETVDRATDGYPAYFGVNCAHPDHLPADLVDGAGDDIHGAWTERVRAFRANASRLSHAELDDADDLDDGDPAELGAAFAELVARMPQLRVLGGCCGTDDRHIRAIAAAVGAVPHPVAPY